MEEEGEGYWGVETVGIGIYETGSVTKRNRKTKLTTGIGANLSPDYRDKEESNNYFRRNLADFV